MRRSAALQPLSHDHHHGLQVAARVRKALRDGEDLAGARAEVAAFGRGELARHFAEEEALLLPLLQRADAAMADRLVREHEALRALVAEVEGGRGLAEALGAFAEQIAAHVRFEEREAFPAVEAAADAETLAAIGRHLHGAP